MFLLENPFAKNRLKASFENRIVICLLSGEVIRFSKANDRTVGLFSTLAGGGGYGASEGSFMGNYAAGQGPTNALDNNLATKYTSYGMFAAGTATFNSGDNTGFYTVLSRGSVILTAFSFGTGNGGINTDPMLVTIEGSAKTTDADLNKGASWTLLYTGTTGLTVNPGRLTKAQCISVNNTRLFQSYRVLITRKRGIADSVQYSEMELLGLLSLPSEYCFRHMSFA